MHVTNVKLEVQSEITLMFNCGYRFSRESGRLELAWNAPTLSSPLYGAGTPPSHQSGPLSGTVYNFEYIWSFSTYDSFIAIFCISLISCLRSVRGKCSNSGPEIVTLLYILPFLAKNVCIFFSVTSPKKISAPSTSYKATDNREHLMRSKRGPQ